MKRRLFFLVLMVMSICSPLAVMAYDFSAVAPSGQTLYYNIISDSTVEVTSQNSNSPYHSGGGPVGTLVIPDTVTNPNTGIVYNVESIGSNAFNNCDNITMVQIANSVTSIGDGVFYNCDRLSEIDFGDSLTSIGGGAFYRCYSLTDIVFPESLRTIGGEAFRYSYITSVTFPTALITVDETAFWECPNFSKAYFMDSLPPYDNNFFTGFHANLYVPCQYISNYQEAFFWSSDISSRIYGKNDNWEPSYNFVVNDSLAGSISFTDIDCDSNIVVTVNVNEGYRHLGWSDGGTGNPRTFHITGDTMVTAIIINPFFSAIAPSGQTLYYNIVDNNRVVVVNQNNTMWEPFYSDGAPVGALIIPDSVTHPVTGIIYVVDSIGDNAFAGCNNLTSVIIPNSVTSIGDGAFQFSGLLSHIEFGNAVISIGYRSFYECYSLTNIIFPESLITIGENAFGQDANLTSITLPSSLTTIEDYAFQNCSNLFNVYIKAINPPSIGYNTFAGNWSANFYVPCQSVNIYETALFWNNFSSRIYGKNFWEHSYNFVVNDSILGGLSFTEIDCDSNVVVTVSENIGCQLIGWSDGGMGNPRTFHLVGDTMVTAILDYIPYSVTVQPNDTLRGIVMGNDTVHYGDTVVIAATANYGYHFSRWNDGNTNNPRTLTITQDKSFTAIFDKNNYNIVLSADTNIHGHMTGMGDYEYLDNRTISAIANHGYHFTHWNDGDTNNPRIITLTQDTAFTAYFAKNIYTTIVQSSDTVRGSAMGNATTEYLDTVVISATANYGYHFSRWNDGNTNNPRTIVVTDNNVYTAIFDKNNYNIALSADTNIHGYMTGMGDYEYLDNRTISAVPNYGYHFTHWNDGDTNNPRVITLTQDTAFTAYFANNTYILTVLSNDSVLGEVSGSTVCEYLDTVSITATTIMPHYHFVQWSDGNTEAVRNVVVTCDSVVTAIFAIDTHSVVLAVNNDNYGTVTDGCNVPYGNTVTIEAFASEGYHFAEWSNGSRNNPETITVISDTMITAIFTDDVVPQICMVDVRDGYNTVLWEKGLEVMNYNIYREGDIAGSYEMVATVPYDSLSQWVDSVSRPTSRSYRYRMTATDIYGYESEPGDIHKTMHLTINKGIGNQWNLVWTEYEGTEYTTYIIYRGTNASNIEQIDVIPAGGNTTYTDENAQEGDVYYQVGVMVTSPCNPSKSSSVILSNIATNGNVGILDVDMTNIKVFSKDGKIIVHNTLGKSVQVFDMEGRTIFVANNTYSSNDGQVSISVPKSGVYLVKVGEYPARKVVVIK